MSECKPIHAHPTAGIVHDPQHLWRPPEEMRLLRRRGSRGGEAPEEMRLLRRGGSRGGEAPEEMRLLRR
ncbi:hypothetical protein VZT92_009546 [Zoarces viviparus]|uniref:Uncharacterized protein n=1 Tax=Zoarces viviparus TaxID=48416 RepID=A0AAW1FBW7_ZOAVI